MNGLGRRDVEVGCYNAAGDLQGRDWFNLHVPYIDLEEARDQGWDAVFCDAPELITQAMSVKANQYFVIVHHLGSDMAPYYTAMTEGAQFVTTAEWITERIERMGTHNVRQILHGVNYHHFYALDNIGPTHGNYILVTGAERKVTLPVLRYLQGSGWPTYYVGADLPFDWNLYHQVVVRPDVADYRRLYSGARFLFKADRRCGCSLAPLEAISCGTPVVRAIDDGDDEMVTGEGCLRVPYDVDSAVNAVQAMIEDQVRYNRIANSTRELSYYWPPVIDRIMYWLE